jgi:NADP-dependent 3-hydroxy acid dehydrogenase YdfG
MKLKNKVSVITGASSGIGEATAELLAKEGAKVVLAARRKEKLDELKKKIEKNGGTALVVETDMTDKSAVNRLAEKTKQEFGNAHILVNNAGLMPLSFMDKLHIEEWEKMVDVNIKGVLYGYAAFFPQMKENKGGHIVNISSVAGKKVMPGGAVYCATKFAVRALSEGLRMELAPKYNIKVTSIEPGAVETELLDTITDEDIKELMGKYTNIERLQSQDIAESILYAVQQPGRVNIGEVLVMPTEQK